MRPARLATVRRYEALRVRRVLTRYRRAAAADAEDFAIVEELLDSAQCLAALVLDVGPDDLGENSTFRATGQADATAQYLDVVASNLLVWAEPERSVARCDECGAATDELVSLRHGSGCSLSTVNVIGGAER